MCPKVIAQVCLDEDCAFNLALRRKLERSEDGGSQSSPVGDTGRKTGAFRPASSRSIAHQPWAPFEPVAFAFFPLCGPRFASIDLAHTPRARLSQRMSEFDWWPKPRLEALATALKGREGCPSPSDKTFWNSVAETCQGAVSEDSEDSERMDAAEMATDVQIEFDGARYLATPVADVYAGDLGCAEVRPDSNARRRKHASRTRTPASHPRELDSLLSPEPPRRPHQGHPRRGLRRLPPHGATLGG